MWIIVALNPSTCRRWRIETMWFLLLPFPLTKLPVFLVSNNDVIYKARRYFMPPFVFNFISRKCGDTSLGRYHISSISISPHPTSSCLNHLWIFISSLHFLFSVSWEYCMEVSIPAAKCLYTTCVAYVSSRWVLLAFYFSYCFDVANDNSHENKQYTRKKLMKFSLLN